MKLVDAFTFSRIGKTISLGAFYTKLLDNLKSNGESQLYSVAVTQLNRITNHSQPMVVRTFGG